MTPKTDSEIRKEALDRLESELATRIPPLLLTVAIFCLGFISNMENPGNSIVDEISSIFAALCLVSASLLIDFLLDKHEQTFMDRVRFLSGGYLLFSITISFAIVLVAVIYFYRSGLFFCKTCNIDELTLTISLILLALTTLAMFAKMMTIDKKHVSLYLLATFSIMSVIWLFRMTPYNNYPVDRERAKCCCLTR